MHSDLELWKKLHECYGHDFIVVHKTAHKDVTGDEEYYITSSPLLPVDTKQVLTELAGRFVDNNDFPFTSGDRKRVKNVFARVLDEMDDSETPADMFRPYLTLMRIALTDKQITRQLDEDEKDL